MKTKDKRKYANGKWAVNDDYDVRIMSEKRISAEPLSKAQIDKIKTTIPRLTVPGMEHVNDIYTVKSEHITTVSRTSIYARRS